MSHISPVIRQGIIVKSLAGFYDVRDDQTGEVITCKGRGLFRKSGFVLLVGDDVKFDILPDGSGTITEAHPRINQLVRPPMANVSKALVVFSAKAPDFNVKFLDRLLAVIEAKHIPATIVISKIDLLDEQAHLTLEQLLDRYRQIGYDVLEISTYQNIGMQAIRAHISGEIIVVCGQSGVGKSSLFNALDANLTIEVNDISKALGRGKHTTRHVELHEVEGALVADTPGFSALDLEELSPQQLREAFAEFVPLQDHCKFRTCLHINEPSCAVKQAALAGEIATWRYDNYVQLLEEINAQKIKY